MTSAIPNIPLRNWRTQNCLSRSEMADRINASPSGIADRLACDEERIRRWESGEVRWPSPPYRRALKELTGLEPAQLGFTPRTAAAGDQPARIQAADAFRSEAELFDTLDLTSPTSARAPWKCSKKQPSCFAVPIPAPQQAICEPAPNSG